MIRRKRPLRSRLRTGLIAMLTILLIAGVFAWVSSRPSHERAWRPEQAVLPRVTIDGGRVHVRNVRDFTYRSTDDFTAGYRERTYELDRIETLWFGLSPFTRDWRGPAHAFLSFGFADG